MSSTNELRPSDEVDDRHLDLARRAGELYQQAIDHMIEDVASTGDKTLTGEYVVGFAQEEAEGMYRMKGGRLEWMEPAEDENCHLEVVVADRADGRFLPGVEVHAGIENDEGEIVEPTQIPFVWHPGLYHYGKNLTLPGDGEYTITISVKPPTFPRHDRENGNRYAEPVEIQFEGVEIETGRG